MNEELQKFKIDLKNELQNDKYYTEKEISNILSNPNLTYKERIDCVKDILGDIAILDLSRQLADVYFKDEQVQPTQPMNNQQSHKE